MNFLFDRCRERRNNEKVSGKKIVLAGLIDDAEHAILLGIRVGEDLVELPKLERSLIAEVPYANG